MVEFRELKDRANNFRKQRQFEQASIVYEQILREYSSETSGWEQVGYASCMRHLGLSDKALDILRECYPKIKNANPVDERLFTWCRNEYGRCIYDTEIRLLNQDTSVDEARLFKAAHAITQLTLQEEFSPYELTVFRIVDYLADKQNPPYEQIAQWLEKLDPVKLSSQPRPAEGDDSRNETYPSPLEKWLSLRTKASLEIGQYAECIKLCGFALNNFFQVSLWF